MPDLEHKDDMWALLDMWRFSLALVEDRTALVAGPMISADFRDREGAPVLAIECGDPWSILMRRLCMAPTATNPREAASNVQLGPNSLAGLAAELVEAALDRPAGDLPLIIPTGLPAGSHGRVYNAFDLAFFGERLTELSQVSDGPELDFHPLLQDEGATIRHEVRIGAPALFQAGEPHVYDYGTTLSSLDVDFDGSRNAHSWWVRGDGMSVELLYGYASSDTYTNAGWPRLESVDSSHTSTREQELLDGYATANRDTYGDSIYTYGATVRWDGTDPSGRQTGAPHIANVRLGDHVMASVQDHPLLPDVDLVFRVLGIQATGQSDPTLELLN
ncbi:hypothetical protein EV193_104372 [Herbihabitans rhizosphaerae]|uniref:Uncharacterized protein n=1 Tax=Herbihabitans rhizosphaerae TaxID=1872711 RepID=A0A4Q7KRW4_9PSEU|nr:hypothetical protein EV193_104372 [Herbihabitans rhizosphaerae]